MYKLKVFIVLLFGITFTSNCIKPQAPKPVPTPVDYTSEFDMLIPNSGFKTLWTYQPDCGIPFTVGNLFINDYTINDVTGKMHLSTNSTYRSGEGNLNVQRLTVDLATNTEVLEEDRKTSPNFANIRAGSFQPFKNTLFSFDEEGLFKEGVRLFYKSALDGLAWRINRNGLCVKSRIYPGRQIYTAEKTYLKTDPADKIDYEFGLTEPVNDTTDYYLTLLRNTTDPTNKPIDKLVLYKSSLRSTNGVSFIGKSNKIQEINLNAKVVNSIKIHYTSNPDILIFGFTGGEYTDASYKFFTFEWNIKTETITKKLDGVIATFKSSKSKELLYDIDDDGNVYFADAIVSTAVFPALNTTFKVSPSGVQQIGKSAIFENAGFPAYAFRISKIKVFNNKPYISLIYLDDYSFDGGVNKWKKKLSLV